LHDFLHAERFGVLQGKAKELVSILVIMAFLSLDGGGFFSTGSLGLGLWQRYKIERERKSRSYN